jgi:predicted RNA binding protein YcfA (HicA-like mRNA interferase family)
MSKLPIISGKKCIKVLEKFGYVIYLQRGSHVTLVREDPPSQTTVPMHKELDKRDAESHSQANRDQR